MTRLHHPLEGRQHEVLSEGKSYLVIRLRDGTSMQIPRDWTDADGVSSEREPAASAQLTASAVRALLELSDTLQRGQHDDEGGDAAASVLISSSKPPSTARRTEEEMNKQMTLRLQNTEQLVTVWRRLGLTSREELARRLASLIAQAAQAEQGPAKKEGSDEHDER